MRIGIGHARVATTSRHAIATASSTGTHAGSVGQCGNVAPSTIAAVQWSRETSADNVAVAGALSFIAHPSRRARALRGTPRDVAGPPRAAAPHPGS